MSSKHEQPGLPRDQDQGEKGNKQRYRGKKKKGGVEKQRMNSPLEEGRKNRKKRFHSAL